MSIALSDNSGLRERTALQGNGSAGPLCGWLSEAGPVLLTGDWGSREVSYPVMGLMQGAISSNLWVETP